MKRHASLVSAVAVLTLLTALFAASPPTSASTYSHRAAAPASTGGYPYAGAVDCSAQFGPDSWCINGNWLSPLGFAYRNCTDFVAWKLGLTWSKFKFPSGKGNAVDWKAYANNIGYKVASTPSPGDIAWWGSERGGGLGHVAYVDSVNSNGTANIEQYNAGNDGNWSKSSSVKADAYLHKPGPPPPPTANPIQFAIATGDGGLWHTIRANNGTWQPKGDLKAKLGLTSSTTAVAETYDPTNVQYVIATADGGLWWTARLSNGTWVPKLDLRSKLGLTSSTVAVTATYDRGTVAGGNVQYVIATADGGLWWTARISSNSSWVSKLDLKATLGLTSNTTGVTGAYDGGNNAGGNLQFVIATADGGLWWTARIASPSSWRSKLDLKATLGLTSGTVAVASDCDGTNMQFVIASADGGLWWTARIASPSGWRSKYDLKSTLGLTSNPTALAAAYGSSGLQVAIATADGGLWHTIRNPSPSSWQPKGDLRAKLGLTSATTAVGASV